MTTRELIRSNAVSRVVRHVEMYGPRKSESELSRLAWECIEGVCERDPSGVGTSYIENANERGLDRLSTEIVNRARCRLASSGIRAIA